MKVKPRSRKYIINYAKTIRSILKISPNKKIDIVKLIEELLFSLEIDFLIVEDYELTNEYAVYSPKNKELKVRESVYVGACNNDARDRMTLAHELGHILLHSDGVVLTRSVENIPAYCDPEWQAFEFARNFLCPIEGILETDDPYDLVERYGISYKAATIQLDNKNK